MVASVQELIAAANAQYIRPKSQISELSDIITGGFDAYDQQKNRRLDISRKIAENQMREEQLRQAELDRKRYAKAEEDATRKAVKGLGMAIGVTPIEKLESTLQDNEEITLQNDGKFSRSYKTADTVSDMTPYQKESLALQKQRLDFDRDKMNAPEAGAGRGAAPAGYRWTPEGNQEPIPGGPATTDAMKAKESKKDTFALYETTRDALVSGLEGTATGPVMGRLPAFTAGQQIGTSGVAQMAPVLKQLFRVSGEGVFTDRDQALLLEMIPDRKVRKEARGKIIENLDAIVKAKLGMSGPGYEGKSAEEILYELNGVAVGKIDEDNGIGWSDDEEQELRELEKQFGGR
jgi:hypothetical protein